MASTAIASASTAAVPPWVRPISVPTHGRFHTAVLVLDAAVLHDQLGGDERAVIVDDDVLALRPGAGRRLAPQEAAQGRS